MKEASKDPVVDPELQPPSGAVVKLKSSKSNPQIKEAKAKAELGALAIDLLDKTDESIDQLSGLLHLGIRIKKTDWDDLTSEQVSDVFLVMLNLVDSVKEEYDQFWKTYCERLPSKGA